MIEVNGSRIINGNGFNDPLPFFSLVGDEIKSK
jgi:hypothetical protein